MDPQDPTPASPPLPKGIRLHFVEPALADLLAELDHAPDEHSWLHLYRGSELPQDEGIHIALVDSDEGAVVALEAGAHATLRWPAPRMSVQADLARVDVVARLWLEHHVVRQAFRNTPAWLEIGTIAGELVEVSKGFESGTGIPRDEAVGRTLAELLRGGTHPVEYYKEIERTFVEHGMWAGDMLGKRRDGGLAMVDTEISSIRAGDHVVAACATKRPMAPTPTGALSRWVDNQVTRAWVLVRSDDARVVECTEKAARYLGQPREAVVGHSFDEHRERLGLFCGQSDQRVDRWVGPRALQIEVQICRAGHVDFSLVVMNDITDRKMAEERQRALASQLEAARDHALAADRAKTAFLASISHELRTPLNAIIGYSELLRDIRGDDAELVGDLERIHRSGSHLLALVDDVLDLARIEQGGIELEPSSFEAKAVLDEVIDSVRLRAAESGHVPTLLVEEFVVHTDRVRLRQILTNLVDNAIKYAVPGEIEIGASPGRFWVRDEGPGLSKAERLRIFQPFLRLKREGEGVGLGLALCRRLAEAMHARLDVRSDGKGSVFELVFDDHALQQAPVHPS